MNVGLIGCGGIANLHMKVYRRMEKVNVVGVCDLDVEKAKDIAYRFGVNKTFQNYFDLFEIKDLDLVDICTPVSTHARIACDAAKAVPAILVEKPMALSVAECDEMIKELKKHGSKLCVIHQQLFLSSVQKAKSLVEKGAFNIASFRTVQKESFEILKANGLAADWMIMPKQKGIIWEVCSHLAYLQLHFLPDIKDVIAVGGKVKYPVYDHFAVLLRGKDQRFGLIDLSWVSEGTEIMYEICDSKGRRAQIYRDFDFFFETNEYPPQTVGGVINSFSADLKRTLQKWARFGLNYVQKKKLTPHFRLISSYIESIERDLPPPITPEDGRRTITLLESIEKSLDENQRVTIPKCASALNEG